MNYLQLYLVPFLISNGIAIFLIWLSWKAPKISRWAFVLLFLWASGTNLYIANSTPKVYLDYAPMASALYRSFILGWFASHIQLMVSTIAVGQFLVGFFLILGKNWLRLGAIGGIIFLLAIMPLGVGSGFPCPLFLAIALFLVYRAFTVQQHAKYEMKKASLL